jgi:hypothetical protein
MARSNKVVVATANDFTNPYTSQEYNVDSTTSTENSQD